MEMFSKSSGSSSQASETREPTVDSSDSFIDHWKSVTNYYIQTTDESRPVSQTDIPWRLRQMSDILVYEEKQQVEETGPCSEYSSQHKSSETLCTSGKAQYPPGMSQQVSLFFSKSSSQMQKPSSQLVPVYRPVQKSIGLCGLPGSCSEKEEAQFLLAVSSGVPRDPHVLRYVLQLPDSQPASSQSQPSIQASNRSTETPSTSSQSEQGSSWVSSQLSKSQKPSVRQKACEALSRVSSLSDGSLGESLPAATQSGESSAGRLQELYSSSPSEESDAAELRSWPRPSWRSENEPDHMTRFLTWWDFMEQSIADAPQAVSLQVSLCVHQRWLMDTLHPQLVHTCERSVSVSTSVLCCVLRSVRSPSSLDQSVVFSSRTPSSTELSSRRCDHISDQISMASSSSVDESLQKPHRDISDTLVLRFSQSRSYSSSPVGAPEDRQPDSSDDGDDAQEMEDDPFFSDGLPGDHHPHHHQAAAAGSPADIINSFSASVPAQVRSAHSSQEGGYESYVHDARSLVSQCQALSLPWAWPQAPPPCSPGKEDDFFEGHSSGVSLDRSGRISQQPYELNSRSTAVSSRLCAFGHPSSDEYSSDPYVHSSPRSRTLFSVSVRVMAESMERIQDVSESPGRSSDARRHSSGLGADARPDHSTSLRAVIVSEEFCKESAAIAFVKMPSDRNQESCWSGTDPSRSDRTGTE